MNLNYLFDALPEMYEFHSPYTPIHKFLSEIVNAEVKGIFKSDTDEEKDFGPYGKISLPFHSMGAIKSYDMVDLDGLILYSYYWLNRNRYKNVADLGANIGFHSILFDKCGFKVRAYEPDPIHYKKLENNLAMNGCENVEIHNAAVSSKVGHMEFIRVLGNTTGSHLAGSKINPYGELDKIVVPVVNIVPIMEWADFVKCDVEGHEKALVLATKYEHWKNTDAMMEVGTKENALAIYHWLTSFGVNMFSQKVGWNKVEKEEDMPFSYHDGSLFISCKDLVPWK
jgi:FkbM family methyltransferase